MMSAMDIFSVDRFWLVGLKVYVVEDKGGAIALMVTALLFLGTWPAIFTLLERRGRLPQHTYLDYSFSNLLAAVIIALTFGQIGDSKPDMPNFFTQLTQDNWPSVLFAMAGGIVLSLGNLSTQYALAYVGLSVTEVITASITVVFGTTMNYFLDDRINKAEILFPGVGCFLLAVCLGSAVHSSNASDNEAKLSSSSSNYQGKTWSMDNLEISNQTKDVKMDLEDGNAHSLDPTPNVEKAKAGTAEFLIDLENRRSIKVLGSSTLIGLGIALFAGICFSLFSPAFNLATNDQWHTLKKGVPHLVIYTAFFYFSISCFVLAIILNLYFLYYPIFGLPRSSLTDYLKDSNGRNWALLAGLLCGFGNGFQFMGGEAAGYAAADSVQSNTRFSSAVELPEHNTPNPTRVSTLKEKMVDSFGMCLPQVASGINLRKVGTQFVLCEEFVLEGSPNSQRVLWDMANEPAGFEPWNLRRVVTDVIPSTVSREAAVQGWLPNGNIFIIMNRNTSVKKKFLLTQRVIIQNRVPSITSPDITEHFCVCKTGVYCRLRYLSRDFSIRVPGEVPQVNFIFFPNCIANVIHCNITSLKNTS
ncbi:putative ureide permease A3 isoform X2 [Tasmannia lanceolata]|uniref:putative ureide permease A3 isoform X2 n=1 Tax=Tasmannia lanceolata TaxID=3420 RepID=UPI004064B5E6